MSDEEKWFISERARALAVVLLTRREDLIIQDVKQEHGLDLLVEIAKNRRSTMRRFGIVLRGSMSPLDAEHASNALRPTLQGLERWELPPLPVCLFYFTMEDDQGYYTWLTEPGIAEDGRPILRLRDSPDCKKLTNSSLETIVQRVNKWYESLLEPVPEKP